MLNRIDETYSVHVLPTSGLLLRAAETGARGHSAVYMQVHSIILHLILQFLIFAPDKTLNFATGITTLIIILPYLSPSICLATCRPSWLSAHYLGGMKLASLAAL